MFGLSGEHILVLLVILLIFGPRRLPDLGHSMGRTLKNFKDAMNGNDSVERTPVKTENQIPLHSEAKETARRASPLEKEPEALKS